jgi:integrase
MGFYQWTIPDSKTHTPRVVWLPPVLGEYIEQSRQANEPRPDWPVLWDCDGRGFARIENPAAPISPRTINNALERARDAINLPMKVTAHIAKHTYCTQWIGEHGDGETALKKLARQVELRKPCCARPTSTSR